MITDIIIENRTRRRIIIDTKFTNILTVSNHSDTERFKTGHLTSFTPTFVAKKRP